MFLVDDHPIVRRGLQLLIARSPTWSSVARRITVCCPRPHPEATAPLGRRGSGAQDSSGLELVKDLRAQYPQVKILAFTMHDEPIHTERVLKAGAHGYVTKEEGAEKAIEAIRQVLMGKPYVTAHVAARMLETMTGFAKSKTTGTVESLSDRELEVLGLIGRGLGSAEIARRLKLSVKTIESHRENIKAKLGLRHATDLVQYAFTGSNADSASEARGGGHLSIRFVPRKRPAGRAPAAGSFPDGQMGGSPIVFRRRIPN